MRKVDRSLRVHEGDRSALLKDIDVLAEKLGNTGYLDDSRVASARATSLRSSGRSTRMIALKLRQKGVGTELIAREVTRVREEISDLDAAREHARRKKLGPFRIAENRAVLRQKDLQRLARAGFSYDVAKRVVDGTAE